MTRFVSPRASESALRHTHRVCNSLTIAGNYRTLSLTTLFVGAKYAVICNWVVLPYIEQRVSCAAWDIWIPSPICPDSDSVLEPTVNSYMSIRSTGLRYIPYWSMTYLSYHTAYLEMPWWCDIDDTSSPWEWIIGAWVNSRSVGDQE